MATRWFSLIPSEIVEVMKKVPKGRLITIVEICGKIARKHRVKACCSLTKASS
ncbi:MAG: hypothetical protein QXI42_08915 [Thermoproteota archaeon]